MKSGKQRKEELKAKRLMKQQKEQEKAKSHFPKVNPALLRPNNSYTPPAFVAKGYYEDKSFRCQDCDVQEVWRGTQQKWWYEVMKGDVWTTATRCRSCRRKERERKTEARRIHQEGIAKKRES